MLILWHHRINIKIIKNKEISMANEVQLTKDRRNKII